VGTDQSVIGLVIEGKAHSMELLRLNNVLSQALTGDKACDRIAKLPLLQALRIVFIVFSLFLDCAASS
jgi:hypothetical protein